jgi:hypothetical protein
MLRALVADGAGQGHGDGYQPFIRVTPARSSPVSNLGRKFLPGSNRSFHTLTENEWHVARLLKFLGAEDVREQFPLWPMAHPHPLADHPEAKSLRLPTSKGTIAIAANAKITHGNFVGTNLPNVITTDLAATVRRMGRLALSLVSCKPRDLLLNAKPSDRMPARLMLEKIYAEEIGAHFALADGKIFNATLRANIERFAPTDATLEKLRHQTELLVSVEKGVNGCIESLSVRELEKRVSRDITHDLDLARLAISLLIWERRIDFNFARTLPVLRPIPLGGAELNRELTNQLLGGL